MSTAQIKNSFNSIGEVDVSISPSTLILKLSVTKHAIRYFVLWQTHRQIIFFGDYTLHHITNSDELVTAMDKIFNKDEVLKLSFSKVVIGFNEPYSLVPSELFDLINKAGKISNRFTETDIVFDDSQITNGLRKFFNNPELLHINSTYLNLLPEYLNETPEKLFVNISKNHIDVIRFNDQKKLHLMNRYDYQAESDFIYFVLLCCDELKIDREKVELVLMGEVDIQSKIYNISYRYFSTISFIKMPDNLYFSKAFETFPKHLHFNLYNLGA
ncbi:MAG: DUF3822 family protein [Bacteroidota bacterium]